MSERDKNLLFIVGGILLVVLVVQFGFRNFLVENKAQKAEKAALEAELKELDVIQKNEKEYIAQTEEWKKKTKEYYKEFPAMVKARDQILYASDMEKRYDSVLPRSAWKQENLWQRIRKPVFPFMAYRKYWSLRCPIPS